jgi:hypothetical protein
LERPRAEAAAAGDTSLLERSDHVDQVAQAAAEPVNAPDDERVVA